MQVNNYLLDISITKSSLFFSFNNFKNVYNTHFGNWSKSKKMLIILIGKSLLILVN